MLVGGETLRNTIWILIGIVILLAGVSPVFAENSVLEDSYTETTSQRVLRYTRIIYDNDPVTVVINEVDKQFKNICQANGDTTEWDYSDQKGSVRVVRNASTLIFTGGRGQESLNRKEKIDQAPWYQAASYSLSQWLRSGQKSIRYWTVHPEDFTVHKMVANRVGEEVIEVHDKPVSAILVEVGLSGAFSLFWRVKYWFRTQDLLFVKYEGVHGPPGTPKTVVELASSASR